MIYIMIYTDSPIGKMTLRSYVPFLVMQKQH